MESIFPDVFFLDHFAKIVFQIVLAGVFLYDAKQIWDTRRRRVFASALALFGVLLGIGLFTQIAVIGAGILATITHVRMKEHSLFGNRATLVLTLSILIFLFFAGPSGLAFDLPY